MRKTLIALSPLALTAAALAADPPSSIAALIAATPNSENVFATSAKTPVVLHVQSGMICQGFYVDIKLVRLSVDDAPPRGERVSCWFKSTDKERHGAERSGDIVLSAERVTEQNAKDPRGDAITAFLGTHPQSHTERSYADFSNRLVADGRTYEPGIAHFTWRTDDGTKMKGTVWVGIVEDWIITIKLSEPDGEVRPDEPLLSLLWVDEAAKVHAAHKLRHGEAQPASP